MPGLKKNSKTDWERVQRDAATDAPITYDSGTDLYDPNNPAQVQNFFATAKVVSKPGRPKAETTKNQQPSDCQPTLSNTSNRQEQVGSHELTLPCAIGWLGIRSNGHKQNLQCQTDSVVSGQQTGGMVMHAATAQELITGLNLVRHPEGGWFRETYRACETVSAQALPERFTGRRAFSTAIYFLLEAGDISALHRIKSDEMWHFYAGSALLIHCIFPDGGYQAIRLGADLAAGELFQAVVPGGCWFGAELAEEGFALVGCTVSPGFDFSDFEMAGRERLCDRYPQHRKLIMRMTN